jgi:hypothetical protein
MMDLIAITALFPDLTQVEVTAWVERGWVLPDTGEGGLVSATSTSRACG